MSDMTVTDIPPAQPAKVDPETLALRSRPAHAIRFKRGVIIGAVALGSASLMGVAWIALKPQVFAHVAADNDLSQPATKTEPEAVAGLPGTYAVVPKLGPPLPGDLGRPILRAQQRGSVTEISNSTDTTATLNQQQAAIIKAARESALIAHSAMDRDTDSTSAHSADVSATGDRAAETPEADKPRTPPQLADDENTARSSVSTMSQTPADSLLAGTVIAASLITGVNSDLPGMVIAQVTQNVFDSVTGIAVLVPQGSRLIGKCDSVVAFGQRRALIVWQRLILPDGTSVPLADMPASDAAGYAGLSDNVDAHSWQLLKGVTIATLLGVGSELSISGENELVRAIREAAQTNVGRAGDQITQRNLDVRPTIMIRPGAPVRLLVTQDVVLKPWHRKEG